jgi:hypothetical protein
MPINLSVITNFMETVINIAKSDEIQESGPHIFTALFLVSHFQVVRNIIQVVQNIDED